MEAPIREIECAAAALLTRERDAFSEIPGDASRG